MLDVELEEVVLVELDVDELVDVPSPLDVLDVEPDEVELGELDVLDVEEVELVVVEDEVLDVEEDDLLDEDDEPGSTAAGA